MENEYQWDLSKFCKNTEECKKKLEECVKNVKKLDEFKGKLGKPENLKQFLTTNAQLENEFLKCYIYAKASLDVEFDNSELQELVNFAESKATVLRQTVAPFDVEIKNLGCEYLEKLKQDPEFAQWKLYLDSIIMSNKHTLSETEEKLIAEISKLGSGFKSVNENCFFSDIHYDNIQDSNGKSLEVKTGNIGKLRQSEDRTVRKNLAISVNSAYQNYGNLMSQTFINYLNSIITVSKLRKYNSVLQSQLEKYYLSEQVYNNVINFAKEYQKDVELPYYVCKKQLLSYDKFYSYDMHAPLPNENKTYTFMEGVNLVKKAVAVLGQDYVNLVQRAVDEKWIDVYPRDKKRSGGYTWGAYGLTNIVLINWNDDLDSVFTLAHELGHAIHHYHLNQNQEIQNADVPVFMAEVASTFNENLLFNYMLNNTNDENEKFFLLNYHIKNIIGTVFRQCSLSEFEDFCYKTLESQQPLSKNILEEKWNQIMAKPLADIVDYSNFNNLGWQNVWHFYNLSYYVWQYALAFMISSVFAKNILDKQQNAVENYFKFLRGGNQEKPAELLNRLGIDIENQQFYKTSFENFKTVAQQFTKSATEFLNKNKKN